MIALYLTPASIGYLTQFILAVVITGYLGYRALYPKRTGAATHTPLLAVFFAATTVFVLLLFLEALSPPDQRLWFVYLENPTVGLIIVLLLQFAYHFPDLPAGQKWEARLVLGLSLLYTLWETGFAVHRFSALSQGQVYYRPPGPDYCLVIGFLWVPVVFFRQSLRTFDRSRAASWWHKLWKPQDQAARTARLLALVYLVPVAMGVANLLLGKRLIPANLYHLSLSMGLLFTMFFFAVVYLNYLPETTTFMIKLVGATLVTLLAVLGAAGWALTPTFLANYAVPSHDGQTWRFTPNASGGYDVAAVPFSFDENLGNDLGLADTQDESDSSVLEFPFPFYGQLYRKIYVMNDGAVSLGQPLDHRNIQYRYGLTPAIFPLYIDLLPQAGEGGILARQEADRLIITWDRVPAFHRQGQTYTFQLILHRDGVFEFTYNGLPKAFTFSPSDDPENSPWLVGAVPGQGTAPQITLDDLPLVSGPRGVVHDYYLDFRRYLHRLFVPLAILIASSSLAILFGFPLLFYLSLVKPLNSLLAGVRQVDAGNLDVSMPILAQDEIGFLTQAFNGMIGALRVSITTLEDEVHRRTQQLERQNEELARAKALAEEKSRVAETANAEMVRQLKELQARNEELDAFARTVAHDIKSPLSTIAGYTSFLQQSGQNMSEVDLAAALQLIDREAMGLTRVVDALLLLARVRKQEVPLEPVDMGFLLERVLKRLASLIDESQAELVLPSTACWPVVLGYGPWIEEIWVNYISNGCRYGGSPPYLELGGEELAGDQVRFWVRDQGPGISAADQAHLFTPFTQLSQMNGDGHGLGLSIVQRIVDRLGGQAGVESTVGQGSLFYFTLPAESQSAELDFVE